MIDFEYLCKKFPVIMRPLMFVLLFTGVISILLCFFMIIIDSHEDFFIAHKEAFNYIFKGNE